VDWNREQKIAFVAVATRCLEEHAASFCTVAIVMQTSHHIQAQEAKLERPPRARGVAL
jgi:hypothetical protein